jgi:hypothetical protein
MQLSVWQNRNLVFTSVSNNLFFTIWFKIALFCLRNYNVKCTSTILKFIHKKFVIGVSFSHACLHSE